MHGSRITSDLLNRFGRGAAQIQARGQGVHFWCRNKESVEWLQRYCTIRSGRSSQNEDPIVPNRLISLYLHTSDLKKKHVLLTDWKKTKLYASHDSFEVGTLRNSRSAHKISLRPNPFPKHETLEKKWNPRRIMIFAEILLFRILFRGCSWLTRSVLGHSGCPAEPIYL